MHKNPKIVDYAKKIYLHLLAIPTYQLSDHLLGESGKTSMWAQVIVNMTSNRPAAPDQHTAH